VSGVVKFEVPLGKLLVQLGANPLISNRPMFMLHRDVMLICFGLGHRHVQDDEFSK
jgi:hypothetical protein